MKVRISEISNMCHFVSLAGLKYEHAFPSHFLLDLVERICEREGAFGAKVRSGPVLRNYLRASVWTFVVRKREEKKKEKRKKKRSTQ